MSVSVVGGRLHSAGKSDSSGYPQRGARRSEVFACAETVALASGVARVHVCSTHEWYGITFRGARWGGLQ